MADSRGVLSCCDSSICLAHLQIWIHISVGVVFEQFSTSCLMFFKLVAL